MHTQRRHATCLQGMSKKEEEEKKDAYPKKVCHMPTRRVKKKREKEKENIAHTKNITRGREFI